MANFISLLRVFLAFVAVGILWIKSREVYLTAFVMTVIVIWMDGLDGYIARKMNETSKAGSVIDILGDRVVEVTYWISFLALGWIPLWIPLVVSTRGIVVDGLRSLALEEGYTAFGSTSMMKSKLGIFLVSSRASRWIYAVAKAVAFSLMILAFTPGLPDDLACISSWIAYGAVYLSVFLCLIRGLPVLFEAKRFLK